MSKIGKIRPLRFYSEKVLPLVYDNSLSYYEVLEKVTKKLNDLIEAFNSEVSEMVDEVIYNYFVNTVYDKSNETITISLNKEDN